MMRLLVVFTSLLLVGALALPDRVAVADPGASSPACAAPLTLLLRPGTVPGTYAQNGPAARDIPPNPLIVHLPLYPGATGSDAPIPNDNFQFIPSAYRKLAIAEFAVPAGYKAVSSWYAWNLAPCGFATSGGAPMQQHGGPPFAGLFFTSRDGLRWLSLTLRPVSPHLTLVRYLVQALDLPPRPTASFLHGPFVRVSVFYQSQGVIPGSNRQYRFTINWQPTITQLVRSVNAPRRIFVSGLGSGGVVLFTEKVALSFVRANGGIRRVTVGGVFHDVVVGHTRPLVDANDQVLRLVDRLVARRCRGSRACA